VLQVGSLLSRACPVDHPFICYIRLLASCRRAQVPSHEHGNSARDIFSPLLEDLVSSAGIVRCGEVRTQTMKR
jgi:hypothetical protein